MIDINAVTAQELTDSVKKLKPGIATHTKDGFHIRRCRDGAMFEFLSVHGHPDPRRFATPASIVKATFERSAKSEHHDSFGGPIRYLDADKAQAAIDGARAITGTHFNRSQMSQDKADKIMDDLQRRMGVPQADRIDPTAMSAIQNSFGAGAKASYRARRQMAAAALAEGDFGQSRSHLEYLIAHAERNGDSDAVTEATRALVALKNAYPDQAAIPIATSGEFIIRRTEDGHQIYKGGRKHGTPFENTREATKRRDFLNRRARQQAGADEIDAAEAGEVVTRVKKIAAEAEAA